MVHEKCMKINDMQRVSKLHERRILEQSQKFCYSRARACEGIAFFVGERSSGGDGRMSGVMDQSGAG
jgi:hypothetical protein